MTAPAIPNNDTPNFDELDPMERTIQSTLHESSELVAADQPIEGRPRDASGKFVSVAEGQPAQRGEWNVIPDADAPPATNADGTLAAPVDPAEPIIPEGFVALPALAPEKVQGFKVFDAEGEILPPDLKFEVNFRGPNGEVQPRTLDVPKLVNYARMGVYNHEREQQASAVRTENTQLSTQVQEREQRLRAFEQDRERLLTDPDYLMAQLAKHEQENTPQARAEREQRSIDTQRQELEYQRVQQHNGAYLDNQVAPALDSIVAALPNVTLDEVAGRLAVIIEPFKVRTQFGVILDPRQTAAVERAIINELVPWAQQVHMDREDGKPVPPKAPVVPPKQPNAPKPKADADLQARAAKARRLATSALQPVSGNAPQGPPASQTPPKSSRDMEEFVVNRSLSATAGRSG